MDKRQRILIIDDDEALADSVRDALQQRGYETVHAASGLDAFDILRRESIDCIVLDVMLTYRSEGFQIAFDLGADEATRSIPIIMLTGVRRSTKFRYSPDVEGKALPVTRFLEKPIRNEVLCAEVEAVLRRVPPARTAG